MSISQWIRNFLQLSSPVAMTHSIRGDIVAFRRLSDKQFDTITKKITRKRDKIEKDPYIFCRDCGFLITSEDAVISIAGNHRHTFKNPAGIVFEIGCFSSAPGCINMGEPTLEFTWFPGYRWTYSVCGKCLSHLGWFFQSGDSQFYGLILNRLSKNREKSSH